MSPDRPPPGACGSRPPGYSAALVSELLDRLRTDLTAAMRAHDQMRVATLRLTIAAVSTAAVAGPHARELDDEEVRQIIAREVRRRREAAEAFATAGREPSAARERAEAEILGGYLPSQLSGAELAGLVTSVLQREGLSGAAAMGAAMRAVRVAAAGRADGAQLAAEVRRQLTLKQAKSRRGAGPRSRRGARRGPEGVFWGSEGSREGSRAPAGDDCGVPATPTADFLPG